MVTPRERSRANRRRIAGERSRASGPESDTTQPGPQSPTESLTESPAGSPAASPTGPDREPAAAESTASAGSGAPADAPAEPRGVTLKKTEPTEQTEAARPAPVDDEEADKGHGQRPEPAWEAPQWWRSLLATALPGWALAVLAGLLVAALALDGVVVWQQVSRRNEAEASARGLHSAVTEAPSVAEKAAEAVLSYRYDTLDKDLTDARQYLSDDYAPSYMKSIRAVAGPAASVQATVRAQVLNSGVVEAGPDRSDVLLFVNQTTTSPSRSQPQTALNRVQFTMVRQNGTWVVNEIKAF